MLFDALPALATVGEPLFTLKEGVFITPQSMLSRGMCICSSCGHIMSVDNENCRRCGEPKFIVLSAGPNSNETRIP